MASKDSVEEEKELSSALKILHDIQLTEIALLDAGTIHRAE